MFKKVFFEIELRFKISASAGNRTRIYCLEGNNANLYTTDAHALRGEYTEQTSRYLAYEAMRNSFSSNFVVPNSCLVCNMCG